MPALLLFIIILAVYLFYRRYPKRAYAQSVKEDIKASLEKDLKDENALNKGDEGLHGWTPLHKACYIGDSQTAEELLNRGAQTESSDNNSETPLFTALAGAVYFRTEDCIKLLLNRGAEINARNKYEETPVMAVSSRSLLELLLPFKPDLNAADDVGKTIVHHLVDHPDLYLLERVLQENVDLTLKDNQGNTPRDLAEKAEKKRTLSLLINAEKKS